MLEQIRNELLQEAKASPDLLADLANLERYVAESYSGRSYIELLQNADDAGARRFELWQVGTWLVCGNDGRHFTDGDFRSLCRSAASSKRRGEMIGHRGIGFKSVVGLATQVHVLSGMLAATFSRELTAQMLGGKGLAPLVRVPHALALSASEPALLKARKMVSDGLSTVFVFGGVDPEKARSEMTQFEAEYLLFLRNVETVVLHHGEREVFACGREDEGPTVRKVTIRTQDRFASWSIYATSKCEIAVSLVNGQPTPLRPNDALAHAFLPTNESTGLGVRINADFSTDPSRTRIVLDGESLDCLDSAAEVIASMYQGALLSATGAALAAALSPTFDVSTINLQRRSFQTELVTRLAQKLAPVKTSVALAPSWLNESDALTVAADAGMPVIPHESLVAPAQATFLKYLGVRPLPAKAVLATASQGRLTTKGFAELAAHTARNATSGISFKEVMAVPGWPGSSGELSILSERTGPLEDTFFESLNAAGLSKVELRRSLSAANVAADQVETLVPSPPLSPPRISGGDSEAAVDLTSFLSTGQTTSPSRTTTFVSKSSRGWREAEMYVAKILEENGFIVEDASRQNLGFDLLVKGGNRNAHLEVKLLDWLGQPFVLTPNEYAVAIERKEMYFLVLVVKSKDEVQLHFIRDPASTLRFQRQCRQWVLECSEYDSVLASAQTLQRSTP